MFWVSAGTKARVDESLKAIAETVKLPVREQSTVEVMKHLEGWLSTETNGKWFMVLDSVEDCNVLYNTAKKAKQSSLSEEDEANSLLMRLLQSPNGSFLITTRYKKLASRITPNHKSIIDVGPMDSSQALGLLKHQCGENADTDAGRELVKALEFIPLAISQAAAYIQQESPLTTVKKYLDEFQNNEENKSRLMDHEENGLRQDPRIKRAILRTFRISFDAIRSKQRSATDLLSLMCFFDCQGIPNYLIQSSIDDNANSVGAADSFRDDISMLRSYCLVMVNETGDIFMMHGLIQLSARNWLLASHELERFKARYINRLATAFPDPEYSNWRKCRELFAHAEGAINQRPEGDDESLKKWAFLLHKAALFANDHGRYVVAGNMARMAHAERDRMLGNAHEETLASLARLSTILMHSGFPEEAQPLLANVINQSKAAFGMTHPNTMAHGSFYALLSTGLGQSPEAELLHLTVIRMQQQALGVQHTDTLTSMYNLMLTLIQRRDWKHAELVALNVLHNQREVLGEDHPDTMLSMSGLATIYHNQGLLEDAEELEVFAESRRKMVLGEEHPHTLISMNNLARIWKDLGRVDKAIELMEACIQGRVHTLGPEHPQTKASLHMLESWYSERQQR